IRMILRRPAELSFCRMMRPAVTLEFMPHSVVASRKYALPPSMLTYPGLVLAPVMTIAPIPDIRMATALRPPACDSPRLPVCGDLNIATVLDPRGKSPSRGPVASTIGASGASGSMPAGQFSVRSWMATPAPPKYFPNRSSRRSTHERFLLRSTYRTLASGSFGSIGDLLAAFFERQHSMRAVLGTVATMHTDDRLLCFLVPEDSADDTGLPAQSTAGALRGVQKDSSAFTQDQCLSLIHISEPTRL